MTMSMALRAADPSMGQEQVFAMAASMIAAHEVSHCLQSRSWALAPEPSALPPAIRAEVTSLAQVHHDHPLIVSWQESYADLVSIHLHGRVAAQALFALRGGNAAWPYDGSSKALSSCIARPACAQHPSSWEEASSRAGELREHAATESIADDPMGRPRAVALQVAERRT
jgi:hypothetical protein